MAVLPAHITNSSHCPDFHPGDHLCCFFEADEERWNAITHYIIQGLSKGEKTLIILHETPCQTVESRLSGEGFDPQPHRSSGALRILSCNDVYLEDGFFSTERMLTLFEKEIQQAKKEGYSALRVLGDAAWALEGAPGSADLIDYEYKVNSIFSKHRCIALCLYDLRKFSWDIISDILMAHPRFLLCSRIYNNPFCIFKEHITDNDHKTARIRHWLSHFIERENLSRLLQTKESEAEMFFDITSLIMLIIDCEGRICRLNPAGCSITGYTEEEVLGKKFIDMFVHPEERDAASWYFHSLIGLGFPGNEPREGRIVTAHGDTRDIRWRMVLLKDIDGKASRLIASGEDVTSQKTIQKNLEESEKRYSFLFRSMKKGVIYFSADGRIIDVNPAAEEIFGKTRKDMIGFDEVRAELPPGWELIREDGSVLAPGTFPVARFLSSGRADVPMTLGVKRLGADKTKWIVINQISFLQPTPSDPYAVVSLFEDVTEKRELEQTLTDTNTKFQSLFYNSHVPMALLDPSGYMRDFNDAVCSFLGYHRNELAGLHFSDFTLPEDRPMKKNMFLSLMEGTIPVIKQETRFVRKDGSVIWGDTSISSVTIPKIGMMALVICQDISTKKVLELEKQDAVQQIEKNILQLAILNDEIRNPLSVLVALAEIEVGGKTAESIIEQTKRINDIVYKIDQGWVDSEKVRRFLTQNHGGEIK